MHRESNMLRKSLVVLLLAASGHLASAEAAQPMRDATRGELLYTTNCITCHQTQIHWRDKKVVKDWASLKAEIRHWEGFSQLGWTNDDVAEVAQYLNTLYYHFPKSY